MRVRGVHVSAGHREDDQGPVSTEVAVPSRKHDLIRLADGAGVLNAYSDWQKAFLSTLTGLYIEARYPGDRPKLGAMCNREFAEMLLAGAEEMIGWLDS